MENQSLIEVSEGSTKKRRVSYLLVALLMLVVITIVVVVSVVYLAKSDYEDECYHEAHKLIKEATSNGKYLWNKLSIMTDTYGPRLSGSTSLENAIDWIQKQMIADGLENVHTEDVMVPNWVRGNESLYLISPREKKLAMLALGGSVGTPTQGITAEVLVVDNFDELKELCQNATNKILIYNVPWEGCNHNTVVTDLVVYSKSGIYETEGPSEAAKCGAVACILRSITPYSLYTPHAVSIFYEKDVIQVCEAICLLNDQIPTASITIEDSEMLKRMQGRGEPIRMTLKMEAHFLSDSLSRNVMGEITGTDPKAGVVVIGGHTDSWDVGQGAMDDGGGVFVAWEAVRLMLQLGMRPKRTVRVVGWTNEENGARGAEAYRNAHKDEKTVFALESDNGVSKPVGFSFSGSDAAYHVINQIANLLSGIGASKVTRPGFGTDVEPLGADGVPFGGLHVEWETYWWYWHTEADTMDKIDPDDLNECVAAMAVMSYCVADRSQDLPK